MAEQKFKNAAAKLLAQHSIRPGVWQGYNEPKSSIPNPPQTENESLPIVPAVSLPVSRPLSPEPLERVKSKERVAQPNPVRSDMVVSLIKYIVIMLLALVGWGAAAFLIPDAMLSGVAKIAAGLFGGTLLGLIVTWGF